MRFMKTLSTLCAVGWAGLQMATAQEATYGGIPWLTVRPDVIKQMKSIGFEISRQTQDEVKFTGKVFDGDYNFFATFNNKEQLVCIFAAGTIAHNDQALSYWNLLSTLKDKYGQPAYDDTPQEFKNMNLIGLIYQLEFMKLPITSKKWKAENDTEVDLTFKPGFPTVTVGYTTYPPESGFITIDYRHPTCWGIRSTLKPQKVTTGAENF